MCKTIMNVHYVAVYLVGLELEGQGNSPAPAFGAGSARLFVLPDQFNISGPPASGAYYIPFCTYYVKNDLLCHDNRNDTPLSQRK